MTEAETTDITMARGGIEIALCEVGDMLAEMRRILDSGEPVPRRVFVGALESAGDRVAMATRWLDALPAECQRRLKNNRRVATRYDQTADSFLGFAALSSIRLWIRFVHVA
ncbi:hypothetical protein AAFN86_25750 [Roseomonas sp. CAU 1739]|uniref:hypothetical protein n=1 Tax=Roseomonas sp. CAU 1739 TaxID=3140364 RepID=UPI00325AA193